MIFIVLSFLSKAIPEYITFKRNEIYFPFMDFFQYNSPFVVGQAICTVLIFLKIRKTTKKSMVMVSGATLGIYVIHKQNIIDGKFIANVSNGYGQLSSIGMIGMLFIRALLIFSICFDTTNIFVISVQYLKQKDIGRLFLLENRWKR